MRDSHKCRTLKVAPVTCVCAMIANTVAIAIITTVVTAIALTVVRVVGIVVGAKKDGQRICPGR